MKAWLIKQLTEGKLDFAKLERVVWTSVTEVFQHVLVDVLELLDRTLMANRDTKRFECKERRNRTLQTLVGPVTFERRYYRDVEKGEWVHLLDQALGLKAYEQVSPGMVQLAVTWATRGPSYRDARDRLEELYGAQLLSHEGIRQILIEVGEAAQQERENVVTRSNGKRRVDALFIEVDGFNAHLQSPRGGRRNRRRTEAKLAVIHEGWEVRQGKGKLKDYRLKNPTYIPVFDESEAFWERVRGHVAALYTGIDEIPVIVNGDGAEWIAPGARWFGKGMYQYDRFHIVRELRDALRHNETFQRKAQRALANNDVQTVLETVTEALEGVDDETTIEKLEQVRRTFLKHRESIRDYRIRLLEAGEAVDPSWRGVGAAESNVDKFTNRTRKQGRAWSLRGLAAMLTCLAEHFEGNLSRRVDRHAPEREAWILERVQTGAGHMAKRITQENYGVRSGRFPATERGTRGYAQLFLKLLGGESGI